MNLVTEKYVSILAELGTINSECQSRVLRDHLQRYYGSKIAFRKQREVNKPLLLIHTSTSTEDLVNTLIHEQSRDERLLEVDDISHESHFLNSLHTIAAKIRSDLKSTPGHKGYENLNLDSAECCVPHSLYLLMKWIL